ncbi:hypothetical protein M8864_34065, partial [Pseudomonas aeruginosa]|nr:hypothetical protein [Pseudomonas aeruginosa]
YRDLVAGTVQRVVNGVIGTAAAQALLAFGFMGLFLGPILLAVAYNLLSDWIASTPRTPPAEGRGPDA